MRFPLSFVVALLLAAGCTPSAEPAEDGDGDGYTSDEDCNDAVASIHPGAAEVCDPGDVDEDCNGVADNGDPGLTDGSTVYHDTDGDGYGAEAATACEVTDGYVALGGDCDDGDPERNPDTVWYADADADTFGDAGVSSASCEQPAGYVADDLDCDDARADVYPDADEQCDGADQDCDGSVDEDAIDAGTWYADTDGDTYGDLATAVVVCEAPAGYVATATDCDDAIATINPAGAEVCDSADVDEDCDGVADDADTSVDATGYAVFHQDGDGDGYGGPLASSLCDAPPGYVVDATDCDDSLAAVNPGATEQCDAADVDEDCDGLADDADASVDPAGMSVVYEDFDRDGYGRADVPAARCDATAGWSTVATDCDDGDSLAYPGAAEVWYDGEDQDCAGDDDYDQDADGPDRDADCDDTDPTPIVPTTEVLDGADNDCDGVVDDPLVTDVAAGVLYGPSTNDYLGADYTLAFGGDFSGDGLDDVVVGTSYITHGTTWVVDGTSMVGAAGAVDTYDRLAITGSSSYYAIGKVSGPLHDLTADGVPDVLAIGYTGDYGFGYLVSGALTGAVSTSTSSTATFTSDSGWNEGMRWVASGDIDGDGVYDVVTGAYLDDDPYGRDEAGNVSVFAGGALSGSYYFADADDQINGEATDDHLGYSLTVGDLDGDGYDDFLGGAPGEDTMGSGAGAVYFFAGNATLSWDSRADSASQATFTGNGAGRGLGIYSAGALGDVDGDGATDLVLASIGAYVFLDGATLSGTAIATTAGDYTIGDSGWEESTLVSAASDMDGDGADEIVVATRTDDTIASDAGAVYIFSLAGASGSALTTTDARAVLYGTTAQDELGTSLATGGDLDGDGLEDLLVGAWRADAGGSNAGSVYAILGW